MAMSQEQLLAAEFMPRRAQEGLPVIPNNGNPRTIYNMPGTGGINPAEQVPVTQPAGQPATQPAPEKSPYFYPWMAPSPSVDRIRQMIKPQPTSPVQQAVPALQQPQPIMPISTAPIMPMRRMY